MKASVVMLFAAMMLIAADAPPTQVSTPQPSTTQRSADGGQIEKWFDGLADTDPSVRDAARINLLGVSRDQLDALRRVVEANRPIAPSQAAVLHDIVIHVFLASERYEQNAAGFLGVRQDNFRQRTLTGDQEVGEDGLAPMTRECVIINSREPGFCGFQYLQNGDLVLGVIGQDFTPTRTREELRGQVVATKPGDTITLQVLRTGKVMRITFRVSAQPRGAEDQLDIDEFFNARQTKSEEYWQKNFGGIVGGKYS